MAHTSNRRLCLRYLLLLTGLAFGILGLSEHRARAQEHKAVSIDEMSFEDQAITDILSSLARVTGVSVIPDDTVTGRASYYFRDTTFEQALAAFLPRYELHYWKRNGVYYVSRLRLHYDTNEETVSLAGSRVPLSLVLRRLAAETPLSLLFSGLSRHRLSLDISGVSPLEALRMLLGRFPELVLDEGDVLCVRQAGGDQRQAARRPSDLHAPAAPRSDPRSRDLRPLEPGIDNGFRFRHNEDSFSLVVREAPLDRILHHVLGMCGGRFIWCLRDTPIARDLLYATEDLDALIETLLSACDAARIVDHGVSYIVPASPFAQADGSNAVPQRVILEELTVEELTRLLPSELLSRIHILGQPASHEFLVLARRDIADVVKKLSQKLDEGAARLEVLETIRLKHVDAAMVRQNLPPGVRPESVRSSGRSDVLYFAGSKAEKARLDRAIRAVDRPRIQIRYQLLMLQYHDSTQSDWSHSFDLAPAEPTLRPAVTGNLGELIGLRFDIVSVFGYAFAAELNASLAESRAHVLADTVLRALSGRTARFESTSTYRYRDAHLDPVTGRSFATGVTREIVSGITLELTGRMRADGRITVNVDATVSKRGADVSATAGNPPPSSDKELHTTATVAPGKPVLLGELLTTDAATTSRRTPILSRIPLLGWLFRHRNQTTEKATTMLYLIAAPHTGSRQTRTAPLSQAERCMELYRALFPQASSVSGPEPQTLHRNHPRVEAPR